MENIYIKINPSLPHLVTETHKKTFLQNMFCGRINRRNYFLGSILALITPLAGGIILLLNYVFFSSQNAPSLQQSSSAVRQVQLPSAHVIVSHWITPVAYGIIGVGIVIAVPFLVSLVIRRLHDLNKNGWWGMLLFVPVINIFVKFLLLLVPGTEGENHYGTKPLPRINMHDDVFHLPSESV